MKGFREGGEAEYEGSAEEAFAKNVADYFFSKEDDDGFKRD